LKNFEEHNRMPDGGIPIIEGIPRPEPIGVSGCEFVALCLPFNGASASSIRALVFTLSAPTAGIES
jgi:hypothetical protein